MRLTRVDLGRQSLNINRFGFVLVPPPTGETPYHITHTQAHNPQYKPNHYDGWLTTLCLSLERVKQINNRLDPGLVLHGKRTATIISQTILNVIDQRRL